MAMEWSEKLLSPVKVFLTPKVTEGSHDMEASQQLHSV